MSGVTTVWTSCCSMDSAQVQPLNHRITNAGPLWLNLAACCKCCAASNRRLAQLHEFLVVRVLQLCQCPGSVGNLLLCEHAWMNRGCPAARSGHGASSSLLPPMSMSLALRIGEQQLPVHHERDEALSKVMMVVMHDGHQGRSMMVKTKSAACTRVFVSQIK